MFLLYSIPPNTFPNINNYSNNTTLESHDNIEITLRDIIRRLLLDVFHLPELANDYQNLKEKKNITFIWQLL